MEPPKKQEQEQESPLQTISQESATDTRPAKRTKKAKKTRPVSSTKSTSRSVKAQFKAGKDL